MKKIEFSSNDIAQVTLTNDGMRVWENFQKRYLHGTPSDLKLNDRGTQRIPFWQMMLIFGSHFSMDKDPVFVRNRIQIEIPDDGSCCYIEETDISEFVRTL